MSVKSIPLTKGYQAIVDEEDYGRIAVFKWRTVPSLHTEYASRTRQENGKVYNILMHRFILNIYDPKIFVDHKNGNGLDNTKENLRIATRNQNMRNLTRTRANNSSGYRGVSFEKQTGKWLAYIYVNGKQKKLGRHENVLDAALAFDVAAQELFGDFCGKLNILKTDKSG